MTASHRFALGLIANYKLQIWPPCSVRYSSTTFKLEPTVRHLIPALSPSYADRARFAFVEYEDRRDADDAYYEMHNKRLGRDDILKIEVSDAETEVLRFAC